MAIVFTEWLNGNESRSYPVHDSASRQAVDGTLLPNNLIVDANIWLPRSAGRFIYISSVGRTSGLFTLTLLASNYSPFCPGSSSSSAGFIPLAVLRVSHPIVRFKNYAIEALYPGVGGWIALGGGALETEQLFQRFDGPEATQLGSRSVRAYVDAPVTSLGKTGIALTGLIRLRGQAGVTKTYKATRNIDSVDREVAVVALDRATQGVAQLEAFAGACGGRPHVNTCNERVITQINDVLPDDDGDIQLVIENVVVGDIGDGMVLDPDTSLSEVCSTLNPPHIPHDIFGPEPSPSSSSSGPSSSLSSLSSSSSSGLPAYYCEDFEDGQAHEMTVEKGAFSIENTPRSKRYVSTAGDLLDQFSIDRYRRLLVDDAPTFHAIIRPLTASLGEGHLIYAFQHANSFLFAGVSLRTHSAYPNGRFFIGRKIASGGAWPSGLGLGYVFDISYNPGVPLQITDYEFTVRPFRIGPNYFTDLTVEWVGGLVTDTFVHPMPILDGFAGLGVVGSETEFDDFGINCPLYSSSSSSSSPP
jgi:hypothetical protein